jgi:hypothetical protein
MRRFVSSFRFQVFKTVPGGMRIGLSMLLLWLSGDSPRDTAVVRRDSDPSGSLSRTCVLVPGEALACVPVGDFFRLHTSSVICTVQRSGSSSVNSVNFSIST